jgi:hypothetical protein
VSIAVGAVGEGAIAAQGASAATSKKPPRHRQIVAKLDAAVQPEPR